MGDNAPVSSHTQCGYHGGFVRSAGNITVTCPDGMKGRYVSVQLSDKSKTIPFDSRPGDGILNFCEAVVTGNYYKGWFNW